MVYKPDETDSGGYVFEPERLMVPPVDGFLRRMLGAKWGLILVSAPDHINLNEVLDFLANFALQLDFYSEFSTETGDFENLKPERRSLRSLEEVVAEANEAILDDEKMPATDPVKRAALPRNSDIVFIKKLSGQNIPNAVAQAMKGRLVVAGIEANGSFVALGKFVDLLGSSHLAAASLMGTIGFNTVERNCPDCLVAVEYKIDEDDILLLSGSRERKLTGYRGAGCENCGFGGTCGQLLIHETLEISEKLRSGILAKKPLRQLRMQAKQDGMRTLLDAAWDLAGSGEISLDEVNRIVEITDPESG